MRLLPSLLGLILFAASSALAAPAVPFDLYGEMYGAHHCKPETGAGPIIPMDTRDPMIEFSDFTRFCRDNKLAALCAGTVGGTKLTLAQVRAVDAPFRARFQYRSDYSNYGVPDYWANWSVCGDCEDYALTESELLAIKGEGGTYMRLMLEITPAGAHATLLVETSDAGTVEVSVTPDGAPAPVDWTANLRMVTIRMDGKQQPVALPGYELHDVLGYYATRAPHYAATHQH